MSSEHRPAHTALLLAALDTCGSILRRSLAKIDNDSAYGDAASARIAHVANAIDKCRNGHITRGSAMEACKFQEPRMPSDGDLSGFAVKDACRAIYCVLDSFDT